MGYDATDVNGITIVLLVIMSMMMLLLPKRAAIAPLFITVVLMTLGQKFVIFGINFTMIRVLILVGWIRIIARGEFRGLEINPIDLYLLYWVGAVLIIGLIPRQPHPNAVTIHTLSTEIINKGGIAFDSIGSFFLCRCLVRNTDDIICAFYYLIGVSIVLAYFMALEKATGRNLFSVFGVAPEYTAVRDGRLRCQGPFSHPIHAGIFGATLAPLCIGLWYYGKKKIAFVGVVASSFITIASASSGPLIAYFFGIMSWTFWGVKENMRKVRWGLVAVLIALELIMNAHVWWAIAHLTDIIGGGGYWRAKLIDQFVVHFEEWWLIGTRYTAHWSPTGMGLPDFPDMMDITNKFVAEGVRGGLLGLVLFIAIIVKCFQRIGVVVNSTNNHSLKLKYLFWAMGCTLFSYIIAFMSVSTSAQTVVLYYCLLAFISSEVKESKGNALELSDSDNDLKVSYS